MPLSVSLLDRRVSDSGEDCAHGCTPDILSVHCATHGFRVDRVRVKDLRTGVLLTGEVTLLEGIRLLGMFTMPACDDAECAHPPCALIRSPLDVSQLDLVRADDPSRRVHWTH